MRVVSRSAAAAAEGNAHELASARRSAAAHRRNGLAAPQAGFQPINLCCSRRAPT
eukprot:COSAG04_NODE_3106_length_3161_cov_2.430764_4_plen_55_part_00